MDGIRVKLCEEELQAIKTASEIFKALALAELDGTKSREEKKLAIDTAIELIKGVESSVGVRAQLQFTREEAARESSLVETTNEHHSRVETMSDLIKDDSGVPENYVNNSKIMLAFSGKLSYCALRDWVADISKKRSLTPKEVSFSCNGHETYVLIIWNKAFRSRDPHIFDYANNHPILITMSNIRDHDRVTTFMREENTLI